MKFYIKVDNSYVKNFLGIYGNSYFNKNLYAFELDISTGKIELVGVLPGTPANELMLRFWGFKDLTQKFNEVYGRKPERIDLFVSDVTILIETNPRLKKLIKMLSGKK